MMAHERTSASTLAEGQTVAGGESSLTATEARLVQILRGQPGRVFSRRELVGLAMPGTVVLERTIDVHIKTLRKKLGPAASQIQTVRKEGYRFAASS